MNFYPAALADFQVRRHELHSQRTDENLLSSPSAYREKQGSMSTLHLFSGESRKRERESRASAKLGINPNLSIVAFHNFLTNSKSNACS